MELIKVAISHGHLERACWYVLVNASRWGGKHVNKRHYVLALVVSIIQTAASHLKNATHADQ